MGPSLHGSDLSSLAQHLPQDVMSLSRDMSAHAQTRPQRPGRSIILQRSHVRICSQGDGTKFDRFVDPNVRGAQDRVCYTVILGCYTGIYKSITIIFLPST